jgi:hypothetical protein
MGRYGYREESTVETVDKLMSVNVIARWIVTRMALVTVSLLASHGRPPLLVIIMGRAEQTWMIKMKRL